MSCVVLPAHSCAFTTIAIPWLAISCHNVLLGHLPSGISLPFEYWAFQKRSCCHGFLGDNTLQDQARIVLHDYLIAACDIQTQVLVQPIISMQPIVSG